MMRCMLANGLTNGYIDTSAFGRDRVWVAQYPYTPDSSMQWNNDHGAWQWSSQMYFPGLANMKGVRLIFP